MSNIAVVQTSGRNRRKNYSNNNKVVGVYVTLDLYALIKKQALAEKTNPSSLGAKLFRAHLRKRGTTISV